MNPNELIDTCYEAFKQISDDAWENEHSFKDVINTAINIAFNHGANVAKAACKDAIKPFIHQHIVIQELRDLYLSKIDNAEVVWQTQTLK